jgi:membrane protein
LNASPPSAQAPDPAPEAAAPGWIARRVAWSRTQAERTIAWATEARTSHRSVDAGFLAADRDKRVAAGVLAGGVAYRFFFWMLAVSLLGNGALGFIDVQDVKDVLTQQGVDSAVVDTIETGQPSGSGRWWLVVVGVWLVLWTGYLGAKALMLVHATVWGVAAPRVRNVLVASLVFTGTVLLLIGAMSAARWVREESPTPGLVATFAVVLVPFTIWLVASRYLPHEDVGWMGLLPGAVLLAVGMEGLHLFTVYFLGPKLANATELYGVLGVVSTILFWLYLAGRLVVGAATVNASLYEQTSRTSPDDEGTVSHPARVSPPGVDGRQDPLGTNRTGLP